jgi:RHS repeat-associated protein
VAYTLNGVGEVTSTQTDLGLRLDYQLDANSLWAGVRINQELEFEFQRDACGNEIGRSVPGGIQLEQRYDEMSRLVEQRVLRLRGDQQGWFPASARTGDVLLDRSYLRDPSGLIWKVNDEFAGTEYDYDPAERLLGALRRGGVTERFHYDACGNIAVLADEGLRGVAETLDYGPGNRLLRKGDTYYEHDSEGRLVRKTEAAGTPEPRVWTYVWDAFNQLVGVTRPDGTKWSYAYDAFGRRMRKIGPEGSISFVYSGRVPIHEEEVSDRRWVTWIFGPGQFTPLAKLEGKTLFAVFTDHIGTPIELVDTGNHIVHHCQFSAYGKTLTAPGMPFRFQGQYFDDESGLHYNMFRYYDPEVGRFISPDPTRLRGGYNLYQYAPNPVAWIDPWGLCRRGNQATRDHMDDTRDQFLKENPGFELVAGGRDPKTGLDLPEQYLPPLTPGTGTKGSSFVDMRFENPTTGQTVHVQTVDPQASGPSGMSQREWDNANRISQQQPSVPVVTVNKGATPPPGSLDASAMSAGPGVVNVR